MEGKEPDARPDVVGASRGQGEPERDADHAAGGQRTGASTEYAANAGSGSTPADDSGDSGSDSAESPEQE